MRLVASRPPDVDSLAAAGETGFDAVELRAPPDIAASGVDATVAVVDEAPVEVVAVRTPAVPVDDDAFAASARLAGRLDATLVVATPHVSVADVGAVDDRLDPELDRAYENPAGATVTALEGAILDPGYPLALDVSNLYTAERGGSLGAEGEGAEDEEPRHVRAVRHLLDQYGGSVALVRLADATATAGGLALGSGDVSLRAITAVCSRQYEGPMVVGGPDDEQATARDRVREWTT